MNTRLSASSQAKMALGSALASIGALLTVLALLLAGLLRSPVHGTFCWDSRMGSSPAWSWHLDQRPD